ncbi:fibroblast growth factor receptor 3-like [Tigriopus californicus]|uniref:fibroblast growth factor receptor 3-like n=1 Tax=Tigriopus californicus TaxID=6832 RepID=UPI0027DA8487|nr:fibroblast growth factor receptor 3-like [Tigriopus californicus]
MDQQLLLKVGICLSVGLTILGASSPLVNDAYLCQNGSVESDLVAIYDQIIPIVIHLHPLNAAAPCSLEFCPPRTKTCALLWSNGSSDTDFYLSHSSLTEGKFSLKARNEKYSEMSWGDYQFRFREHTHRVLAFHEVTPSPQIIPGPESNQVILEASEEFTGCLDDVPNSHVEFRWKNGEPENERQLPFRVEAIPRANGTKKTKQTWRIDLHENVTLPLALLMKCKGGSGNGNGRGNTVTTMEFSLNLPETNSSSTWVWPFVGGCTCLVVLLALMLIAFKCKRKPSAPMPQIVSLTGPRIKISHPPPPTRPRLFSILTYFSTSSNSTTSSSASRTSSESQDPASETHTMKLLPSISIPSWAEEQFFDFQSLELGQVLGKGQYGLVYKGELRDGRARWDVAVKCARPGSGQEDFDRIQCELLKEGEIMAGLPYHDHIANLQGLAVEFGRNGASHKFYLMIQYCGSGSMKSYLEIHQTKLCQSFRAGRYCLPMRSSGDPSDPNAFQLFLAWGYQIAEGMKFLSENGIIHGDLATRNVLLTNDLTAKISDFGLSHQLKHQQRSANLRQTHLPERWMAPEAIINFSITHECDVWSYGVVIWEIFSYGDKPYKDLKVNSSAEFIKELQNGERLCCPEDCPTTAYETMMACWNLNPIKRPTFHQLSQFWRELLSPAYQYEYEKRNARSTSATRVDSTKQRLFPDDRNTISRVPKQEESNDSRRAGLLL